MDFAHLPSNHFLAQPRPDPLAPHPAGLVDTTTLAAHDFDVDNRTGFMPPQPPLQRLPHYWNPWESALDVATMRKLQLAQRVELMELERRQLETLKSSEWREMVKNMPLLPTDELKQSERALRRAHHVLCWLLHFYVQTIPSTEPILIPRSLSIPLLQVSTQLQLPPVITYSDDVLYNWTHRGSDTNDPTTTGSPPRLDNLCCQTTFTGTSDEEEFYLTSARIELRGSEALELMRLTMDEAFVGDDIAIRRITSYLERMATVIQELRQLLLGVKKGVDPEVFYHEIRPWFRGADGDPWGRQWVFQGKDEIEELGSGMLDEVSGASAGQSSLIHALDIYLGVDTDALATTTLGSQSPKKSFQQRMRGYMPRHHRAFLAHLQANPRPLRALVQRTSEEQSSECPMLIAYNAAVKALREFRDAHMTVVALYIIGPARYAKDLSVVSSAGRGGSQTLGGEMLEGDMLEKEFSEEGGSGKALKGTGGTELAKFLKGVRDQTARTYLQQ